MLQNSLLFQDQSEEEEDEAEQKPEHVSQWRKSKGSKPSYALKTPEELLAYAERNPEKMGKIDQALEYMGKQNKMDASVSAAVTASKMKIIDMTGKEKKVMHGYESLGQMSRLSRQQQSSGSAKKFDVPELVHNLDLVISLTENRLVQSEKKAKHYQDMIVSLGYDERRSGEAMRGEEMRSVERRREARRCEDKQRGQERRRE